MGISTHYLSLAAKQLGIPFSFVGEHEALLVLHFPGHDHFIINTKLGLISNAEENIGRDKAFQYELLKSALPIPKTHYYLDLHSKYGHLAKFKSHPEIQQDIVKNFSFPLIVKQNQGSEGVHVFLVQNERELLEKIATIFNPQDKEYDYVLLAQEYIPPATEYRLITYQQHLSFAYKKDISEATYSGNLSPLHWVDAKTELVIETGKLAELEKTCQSLFQKWPVAFAGLDIIEDKKGKLWLIEVNTAPSMALFVKDNGSDRVSKLYLNILSDLKTKYS